MTQIKLVLTVVAVLAVILAAGAGSAAFAQEPQQPGQQPPPGPGIVGGSAVPDSSKYPFMVALLDNRESGSAYNQFICGGTLIDSDSVLTAAHCVAGIFLSDLRVVVGRAQLSSNQGQVRRVFREYIPDGYNSTGASKNDVAILTLDKPVTGITPVKLPLSTENWYEQPGKVMTAAGWGATKYGGPVSDQMQETELTVASDAEAVKVYSSAFVPELMIAAGVTGKIGLRGSTIPSRGKGHCLGDSGGPLFARPIGLRGSKARPQPSQYGIASFVPKGTSGTADCESGVGAFTEVNAPSIRDFIATSMNK